MKWLHVGKLANQTDEKYTKEWWKAHEQKNYFAPTDQILTMTQEQYTAITYSQGNKGKKHMLNHPRIKKHYGKSSVRSRLCHKNMPVLVAISWLLIKPI